MITQNPLTWSMTGPDPSDGSHPIITVGTNDPRWYKLSVIKSAQEAVVTSNKDVHDRYIEALQTAQASIDAGRGDGVVAPAKPKMKVVDDLGNESEVDFVPPLPDLVATPKPTPQTGLSGDQSTRPPDPVQMLQAHTQILLAIQRDVAAIKAKVGA